MKIQDRNEGAVAALGTEIQAIMRDGGAVGKPAPGASAVGAHVAPAVMAGLRVRVLHGSPWSRRAFWYLVLGLPLVVWLPVEPRILGVFAWMMLPPSVVLVRLWVGMADLDTRWVMWRRGITVRARFESVPSSDSESAGSCLVHFRTLDGREVTARPALRGCRDEIRYDTQDPAGSLARAGSVPPGVVGSRSDRVRGDRLLGRRLRDPGGCLADPAAGTAVLEFFGAETTRR
ncbi:hypothetical protein [Streptomyces collinus]|uniref:hypothetical protein n=1 Tax=Streptomyces collinus TaxID=42684 RepID=UPI0029422E8A|nr:hypothetical protein [Streptomyces collinus]